MMLLPQLNNGLDPYGNGSVYKPFCLGKDKDLWGAGALIAIGKNKTEQERKNKQFCQFHHGSFKNIYNRFYYFGKKGMQFLNVIGTLITGMEQKTIFVAVLPGK
jgi:hypothetical protein